MDEPEPCLILEIASLGSVKDLLDKPGYKPTPDGTRTYARDVILALIYLYEKQLAHLDIKSDNVLLAVKQVF